MHPPSLPPKLVASINYYWWDVERGGCGVKMTTWTHFISIYHLVRFKPLSPWAWWPGHKTITKLGGLNRTRWYMEIKWVTALQITLTSFPAYQGIQLIPKKKSLSANKDLYQEDTQLLSSWHILVFMGIFQMLYSQQPTLIGTYTLDSPNLNPPFPRIF